MHRIKAFLYGTKLLSGMNQPIYRA